MLEMLKSYSVGEIFIFIVILALAVKEGITLVKFYSKDISEHYDEKHQKEEDIKQANEKLTKLTLMVEQLQKDNEKQNKKIENLIDSDVQDIRSWIVQQHHACKQGKHLDDFEMDCVEKRFACYDKEGGNSYIHNLVEEIREMNNQNKEK